MNIKEVIGFKEIGALVFPIIISQSTILVNGMIDLAITAPLGTEAVAAVSISNAVCAVVFNFLEGFRIGTSVLVARAGAMSDHARVRDIVRTGFVLAAAAGTVIVIASSFVSHGVFGYAGGKIVGELGESYLTVWLRTVPVVLFMYVLTGLFRGTGDTVTPVISSVLICVLNAPLSYVLVYGGCGLKGMGIVGSAWGTMFSHIVGLSTLMVLARVKKSIAPYVRFNGNVRLRIREFSSLALDVGMNTGFTLLALFVFVMIIGRLGSGALAAHQISLQVFNFVYMPSIGFLIAASIIVPGIIGPDRREVLIRTVMRISFMSIVVAALICGGVMLWTHRITAFFSPKDAVVASEAINIIKLVCASELFSAVYMVLRGVLTGIGDSRFLVYEGIVSGYFVFLPLAYFLAIRAGYGVFGGYCAFLVWCAVDCAALLTRLYLSVKRTRPVRNE